MVERVLDPMKVWDLEIYFESEIYPASIESPSEEGAVNGVLVTWGSRGTLPIGRLLTAEILVKNTGHRWGFRITKSGRGWAGWVSFVIPPAISA